MKRKWKFILGFVGIIVLALGSLAGWSAYQQWQGAKKIQKFAEGLRQIEQELYQKQMADTYGGKTPQETLKMYIEAVEKGDYELASKYFVEEKRNKELKSFENATTEDVVVYLKPLKNALGKSGKYAMDGKYFSFDSSVLINMLLYPNGAWKIIEI